MFRRVAVSLTAFLIFVSAQAFDFYQGELDNGLKYFIYSDSEMPVSNFNIYVRTGSNDEGVYDGSGISHYIEHIVAGGKTDFDSEDNYRDTLQSIGAMMNAYTSNDVTCYFIASSDEFYKTSLRTLSQWVLHCSFDTFEVNREKGVIEKEIIMYDVPSNNIYYGFADKIYRNSSAKMPVTGYLEPFKKITRENILDYYSRRYAPENMILVCAGNLGIDSTKAAIEQFFKTDRKPFKYEKNREPDYNKTDETFTSLFPIENEKTYINYNLGYADVKEYITASILSYMLQGNGEMLLTKKFIKEKGEVFNIDCFIERMASIKSNFILYFEAEKDAEKTAHSIDSIVRSIGESGKYVPYFNEAKKKFITDAKMSEYSSWASVDMISNGYIHYNDPLVLFKADSIASTISYEDIMAFVKKYMKNSITFTARGGEEKNYPEKKEYKIKNFTDEKLYNGNTVRFYKTDKQDYSIILVSLPFGTENSSKIGSGRFISGMMYDAVESSGFLKRTNGNFYCYVNEDNTTIGVKVASEYYEEGLTILKDMIKGMKFDKASFDRTKKRLMNNSKNVKEDPADEAWRRFLRSFVKDAGLYITTPTEDEIESVTDKDIKTDLENMKRGNFSVYVYGYYDKQSIKQFAETIFSDKKAEGVKSAKYVYEVMDSTIEEAENDQSNICIGYFGDSEFSEREMYALYLFSSFFNGSKSVIHQALRGENDYVYYGYGYLFNTGGNPAFFMNAQTSKEKTDFVVKTMEYVLDSMLNGGFTDADLENLKKEKLLKVRFEFSDQLRSMMGDIGSVYDGFKDRKYVLKEKISDITREEVLMAARKLIKTKSVFIYK